MKGIRAVALVVVVVLFTFAIGSGVANAETSGEPGTVELISVDTGGNYADANSQNSDISADGRYVAFGSSAGDLVDDDENGVGDIFLRDRMLVTTELVSLTSEGDQANGASSQPSISADGRYVAFQSAATNLVDADSDTIVDIYLRDLWEDQIALMSNSTVGSKNGASTKASVTCDDQYVYVAFESTSSHLVASDTNGTTSDVFVSYCLKNDLFTVYTNLVSKDSSGNQGASGQDSYDPSISGDGSYVAYESEAALDDGSPNDSDNKIDIYVTAWKTTIDTELASVGAGGAGGTSYDCLNPSISADGKYVAYDSKATSLVTPNGDPGTVTDVFVTDWNHGDPDDIVTVKASPDKTGGEGNGASEYPSISADGRYVAFESGASDLVATDSNGYRDIFVRDLVNGLTYLVSTDLFGVQGDDRSGEQNNSAGPQVTPSLGDVVPQVSFFSEARNLVFDLPDPYSNRKDVFVGTIDTTPTITYLSPTSGPTAGGTSVYIVGTNFVGLGGTVSSATYDDLGGSVVAPATLPAPVTFDGWTLSRWQRYNGRSTMKIIATSPAHAAGTVQVQVTAAGGQTADTAADDYTYVASPVEQPKSNINRYEEDNGLILYSGDWGKGDNDSLSKKAGTSSDDQQATITITFKGTKLDWIATLGPNMGKALVSIDGGEAVLVDLYSATELYQQLVWSTGDLEYGVHTLTITFPEGADYQEGKGINLDALDVTGVLLKTEEVAKP